MPKTAPDFAIAADNPAPLARIEVGKTSPESRKVVELGPAFIEKLKIKNPVKTKIKLELLTPAKAKRNKPKAIPMKPKICSLILPILSTNKTAAKKTND